MPGLIVPYATLEQLRARFNVAATDTADDSRLLAKLRAASAQMDRHCARTFSPYYDTRRFDWINARLIVLRNYDLLQLTTLTNGDGNVIDPTAIITLGNASSNGGGGPLYALEIDVARGPFLNYLTTKTRALTVSGLWGWHDDWLVSAWKPSGDTITGAALTSTASTFTVSSAAAADGWGLTPRFQTGQLLQIDSEYLLTSAVNQATNTLSVIRGVNGSVSVSHNAGAPISIYVPPADITEIALRWAAWLTKTEDAGEFGGLTADGSAGGVHVPAAIPPDLLAALEPFRKLAG